MGFVDCLSPRCVPDLSLSSAAASDAHTCSSSRSLAATSFVSSAAVMIGPRVGPRARSRVRPSADPRTGTRTGPRADPRTGPRAEPRTGQKKGQRTAQRTGWEEIEALEASGDSGCRVSKSECNDYEYCLLLYHLINLIGIYRYQ